MDKTETTNFDEIDFDLSVIIQGRKLIETWTFKKCHCYLIVFIYFKNLKIEYMSS